MTGIYCDPRVLLEVRVEGEGDSATNCSKFRRNHQYIEYCFQVWELDWGLDNDALGVVK